MQIDQVKLENYAGLWCIEPTRFTQLCDMVSRMDLRTHVAAQEPRKIGRQFATAAGGSVAVIDIQGTMTKAGSSLGGGGTVEARQAIRQAGENKTIGTIILRFDSPGGTVAGTADLAAEVANSAKPVVGYIEDLCCSAAMWVASQCDEVYANNATAIVGSIGTFMGLFDVSKAFEKEGIKPVLIKAGEFKGGGFPGEKISDKQVAEWQKIIDAIQSEFTAGIAKGRGLSLPAAGKLATGVTYLAEEAVRMRLIDGVMAFDDLAEHVRGRTTRAHRGAFKANLTAKEQWDAACRYEQQKAASFGEPVSSVEAFTIARDKYPELRAAMLAES